ncbi:MAG: hypothetical protein KKE20_04475 [Nanoarchaeota archaeon]|nr:hypothetical protein [Nanoarchaeota archaeon]
MSNPIRWMLDLVLRTKKRSKLANSINEKIDGFLSRYFPRREETVLRKDQVPEAKAELDDIKKTVLGLNCLGFFEMRHVKSIMNNLNAYYFERLESMKMDARLDEMHVSEIIDGMNIIKHIVIHSLERKHKDIAHAAEGIRLHAKHMMNVYFHKSLVGRINAFRAMDLTEDFEILKQRIEDFKRIAKKAEPEYKETYISMDNIVESLDFLIYNLSEREGSGYRFLDNRQIVQKLELLIEISEI